MIPENTAEKEWRDRNREGEKPVKNELIVVGNGAQFHQEPPENPCEIHQRIIPPWDGHLGHSSTEPCSSRVESCPWDINSLLCQFSCATAEQAPRCKSSEAEKQRDVARGAVCLL